MIGILPLYLIRSLLLTMLMEGTASYILGVRSRKDLAIVLLAQAVTNPAIVTLSYTINLLRGISGRNLCLLVLEPIAVIIEGLLYKKNLNFKKINPFVLSLLLNVISFGVGEIINML